MAERTTYIKLDRNITKWRWYQNANTFRVFIHCLIEASVRDHDVENITIKRGQFPTTYKKIANSLLLTIQQVRTAIDHLKSTGEITSEEYNKMQVITVQNYDLYQGGLTDRSTFKQHSSNIQATFKQHLPKNGKNGKNGKNNIYSAGARAKETQKEKSFDAGEFFQLALQSSMKKSEVNT